MEALKVLSITAFYLPWPARRCQRPHQPGCHLCCGHRPGAMICDITSVVALMGATTCTDTLLIAWCRFPCHCLTLTTLSTMTLSLLRPSTWRHPQLSHVQTTHCRHVSTDTPTLSLVLHVWMVHSTPISWQARGQGPVVGF